MGKEEKNGQQIGQGESGKTELPWQSLPSPRRDESFAYFIYFLVLYFHGALASFQYTRLLLLTSISLTDCLPVF